MLFSSHYQAFTESHTDWPRSKTLFSVWLERLVVFYKYSYITKASMQTSKDWLDTFDGFPAVSKPGFSRSLTTWTVKLSTLQIHRPMQLFWLNLMHSSVVRIHYALLLNQFHSLHSRLVPAICYWVAGERLWSIIEQQQFTLARPMPKGKNQAPVIYRNPEKPTLIQL